MPVIVIIVLIVLALIILRYVFAIIGIVLLMALLGGVAGIVGIVMAGVAMVIAWLGARRLLLLRLTSPSGTGAIYLSQENGQLVWTVDRGEVERRFPGDGWLLIAVAACYVGTIVALVSFGAAGSFEHVEVLEVVAPPGLTVTIAVIGAFAVTTIVGKFVFDPRRRFQETLLRAVECRIAQANGVCAAALTELREVEAEIESIGEAINVRIVADYGPALEEAMAQLPAATLQSLDHYVQAVAAVKGQATKDREELVRAITAYQDADAVFHEAEAAVLTTGSAVLLSRLDELHSGLYGEELPALLMVRQWGDFGDVVAGIRGELERLASDAAGFAPPGGSRRSAGGKGKRQGGRGAAGRMTAAEAFRILGVPPTADAAKIKQVYHALAMAWHADTSGLGNDDRMKELNAAYACLQQAGHA